MILISYLNATKWNKHVGQLFRDIAFTGNYNISIQKYLKSFLPWSGALAIFSWVRVPDILETHRYCVKVFDKKRRKQICWLIRQCVFWASEISCAIILLSGKFKYIFWIVKWRIFMYSIIKLFFKKWYTILRQNQF